MNVSWMEFAACGGEETNRWFPDYARPQAEGAAYKHGGHGDAADRRKNDIKRVLGICANCPVREDCERYAIDERIEDGIWGGRLAADRKRRPYVLADRDDAEIG